MAGSPRRPGPRGGPVGSDHAFFLTGDAEADALLAQDRLALLVGMLLDQQVPMEWAFAGPATLKQRLGHLDPKKIAAMDVDEFVAICCEKPAIHRFPGSMGKRIHAVCEALVADYRGNAANIWKGVDDADEVYRRLRALPGYGDEKAKIFIALLGKRMSVQPTDWQTAAGVFGDDVPRSVADSDGPESLGKVREWKKAQKAAKKDKQGRAATS